MAKMGYSVKTDGEKSRQLYRYLKKQGIEHEVRKDGFGGLLLPVRR